MVIGLNTLSKMYGPSALQAQYKAIISSITTYWGVSLLMTFLNKHLLSESELIDTPLFITWMQALITTLLIVMLRFIAIRRPERINFPELGLNRKTMLELIPVTYTYMGMLCLCNTCQTYMEISTWGVVRLGAVMWAVFIPYFILGTKVSGQTVACCMVLMLGYIMGVSAEQELGMLSWKGAFFGLLSSLFVALQTTYTKKLLPVVDNNVWRLMFYNNLNAAIFIPPLIYISGEYLNLVESWLDEPFVWIQLLLSGGLALGMSYTYAWMIQVTSPLTCNVAGASKMMMQTFLAVMFYDEHKSAVWWLANIIVTASSVAYSYVRNQEMKREIVNK